MAKALPRGVREKNGSYEARAVVNGIRINLYGTDLNELMEEFEKAKENARDTLDYRKTRITLNEWFEEWFSEVKQHRVKETSIAPMKNNFKRTFGFYIGSMKLKDIKPLDVQRALNAMEQNHVSHSAMREALGRLRECLDFALGNQLIKVNPCLIVEVPWTFKQSKEEIALTQEEQDNFLSEMEDSWYKEMFYFMCLTGVRVGDDDDKIRLNQRKPSKYKGLRRFGPEKNLQRINKFMKERPIFYKNLIQMKENIRFYLRCFYCITKVMILQFNSENRTELARNG